MLLSRFLNLLTGMHFLLSELLLKCSVCENAALQLGPSTQLDLFLPPLPTTVILGDHSLYWEKPR